MAHGAAVRLSLQTSYGFPARARTDRRRTARLAPSTGNLSLSIPKGPAPSAYPGAFAVGVAAPRTRAGGAACRRCQPGGGRPGGGASHRRTEGDHHTPVGSTG